MFFSLFLFIAVFAGFGMDSRFFAAFMSQVMGEYPACGLKYIIRKHMVAVGRMLLVLFCQQFSQQLPILLISV
jgi:hypothetical protein